MIAVDTNILVYLASSDAAKADRAESAIAGGGSISVQVLNELANVARRKMQMTWDETHALLATLRGLLTVHPVTVETHEAGLRLAERYGLSIYDAMIAGGTMAEVKKAGQFLREGKTYVVESGDIINFLFNV